MPHYCWLPWQPLLDGHRASSCYTSFSALALPTAACYLTFVHSHSLVLIYYSLTCCSASINPTSHSSWQRARCSRCQSNCALILISNYVLLMRLNSALILLNLNKPFFAYPCPGPFLVPSRALLVCHTPACLSPHCLHPAYFRQAAALSLTQTPLAQITWHIVCTPA